MKKDEDIAAVARIVAHFECMALGTSEYRHPFVRDATRLLDIWVYVCG